MKAKSDVVIIVPLTLPGSYKTEFFTYAQKLLSAFFSMRSNMQ